MPHSDSAGAFPAGAVPSDALAAAVVTAAPFAGGAVPVGAADGRSFRDESTRDGADGPLRQAAAEAVADVIAASFAIAGDPAARADRDRLLAWALAEGEAAEPSVVIGTGRSTTASRAALVGGFQAHALDLDDTHELVRGHPSAVLVPTLLSLGAPEQPVDALLAAYVVGLEVMARLGVALGPAHYRAGFHPTGTAGAVAAAAAGAHLNGFDVEETATALSIAASRSAGLRAQFGTPGKPLHAGLAAQAGVEAVQWARTGLRTAAGAVTGPAGLLAVHGVQAEGGTDPAATSRATLVDGFGVRWAALEPGIWFKRHPFCSAAMSMTDAAAEISARLLGGPAARAALIAEVIVRVRPGADAALVHRAPATGEEARFSAEALLAIVLLGLAPDITRLGPRPLEADVQKLAARVRREHVPAPVLPDGRRDFWAQVEVVLVDGTVHRAETPRPLGAPDNPLPPPLREAKLAEATGDPGRAQRIRSLLGPGGVPTRTSTSTSIRPTIGALARELAAPPTPTVGPTR